MRFRTVSLAQQHQAQLTFLHVVEPVGEATFNTGRSICYASTRLEKLMAETAKLIAEREFIVETGEAAEAIAGGSNQDSHLLTKRFLKSDDIAAQKDFDPVTLVIEFYGFHSHNEGTVLLGH